MIGLPRVRTYEPREVTDIQRQMILHQESTAGDQRRKSKAVRMFSVSLWAVWWVSVFRTMKRTNDERMQAEFPLEEDGRGGPTMHEEAAAP